MNTIGVMKEGARLRLRVLFVYGMGYSARAASVLTLVVCVKFVDFLTDDAEENRIGSMEAFL